MNKKDKIKGAFISQIPVQWIEKLPSNSIGHTYRIALYIWYLKGIKKTSKDLVITLKDINSFLSVPAWSFPKALEELEKCGMIHTTRQRGKSPLVTILCDDCYEEYPTLK
ncbi:hypothetical protein [Methanosarcina mazei]|nr:hypothetical protein [Methanosarcina mazei]